MGGNQEETLFVFDEPTIGLHPADVRSLLNVFQSLLDRGATVIVIEHHLDVINNADYIIDVGPGGGKRGRHCSNRDSGRSGGKPEQHYGQIYQLPCELILNWS